ncbi:hypothetical protein EVJ33_11805 [Exiguobacterium sp. SL-10]|uniref:site-2 protease family protein n=1 Tax=unclassified Exiguobacterium TaxID=2644629 RepID=UPI00103F2577|nr:MULTISPECIES: site-2 protease family protein [unclassified Exiguobacterium]TCI22168.1 hypothetical protein EVJ34_05995 [Exiguobacterium sp. SL-9]TCI28846.1 hypothetical protein EVJ33_11805 [Exiguobacterium sp. SL-10]
MFDWTDIDKFIISFFIILPIVTIIHQFGHFFFAKLFGGSLDMEIGTGKKLFKVGRLQFNRVYFYDAWCQFSDLKYSNRLTRSIVYAGGSLFNLASILIVNGFILTREIEPTIYTYQFAYFSFYYIFFSLYPIYYSNGHPSDGRAIFDTWKKGKPDSDPLN